MKRTPSTWIYHLAGASPYFTATTPGCTVTPQGRTSVALTCPRATTVIRRETELPGWSASVDGRPVAVGRVDGVFQSVRVGAGSHVLRFSYEPPRIWWGLAAFLAGCLWLLVAAVRARRSTRPGSPDPDRPMIGRAGPRGEA